MHRKNHFWQDNDAHLHTCQLRLNVTAPTPATRYSCHLCCWPGAALQRVVAGNASCKSWQRCPPPQPSPSSPTPKPNWTSGIIASRPLALPNARCHSRGSGGALCLATLLPPPLTAVRRPPKILSSGPPWTDDKTYQILTYMEHLIISQKSEKDMSCFMLAHVLLGCSCCRPALASRCGTKSKRVFVWTKLYCRLVVMLDITN